MTLRIDEMALCDRLRPLLQVPMYRQGLTNLVNDRLMLAIFLMGSAEGERLGELGVAAIRQEEVAALIHDLRRHELEEHGHSESARIIAEELFPEYFDAGAFRYDALRSGAEYYFRVRELNRARLKADGRYSRLNLYMTTSFGYEIMVQLLYAGLLEAIGRSELPRAMGDRVNFLLTATLAQEKTHLEMVDQHNALLVADRRTLSVEAGEALDMLAQLSARDYEWAAEVAVREIVPTVSRYADVEAFHAQAEAGAAAS